MKSIMRSTPPTLRRRNNARFKEHRRWPSERRSLESGEVSGDGSDFEDGNDTESDSGLDSDDEGTLPRARQTLRSSLSGIPTLTHALSRPAASSTVIPSTRTVSASTSRNTTKAVLPTAGLGLGSSLLVGEGDVDVESETDSIASDDDSDDETTPGAGSPTSTPGLKTMASPTSTITRAVPTSTSVVPPGHSGAGRSTGSTDIVRRPTSEVTSSGIQTFYTSVLQESGLRPAPITTTLNQVPQETTPAEVFSPQIGVERSHMNSGVVAGVVFGVIVGVSILAAICILGIKKLRADGHDRKLMWPFSRGRDDDNGSTRPKTTGTTWTWNRNLWGAVSSSGPRTTISSIPPPLPVGDLKDNPKTNSDIINHLIQASYNAENQLLQNPNYHPVLTLHKDLNPKTPHFPPSPTSFINEKAYNALEGPWPPYAPATPARLKRSSKPPAVTRWLDGILTPRLSKARMSRPIPQGTMAGTRWQEDPGVAGLGGLRPPPVRKLGDGRETMRTETTVSSVVW